MKKRLLFLGALALTAMSSFAQATWTAPEVTGSELVPGEKVFLYNKEAAGFLRGLGEGSSPYWGSRAGVGFEGMDTVIIQPAVEASIKEGTSPTVSTTFKWDEEWDGKTYILQNYASHITSPRWDEVWFSFNNLTDIWTDRQNNVDGNYNFFWDVTKNDNGTYSISVSKKCIGIADADIYASFFEIDAETGDTIKRCPIKGGERLGVDPLDANGETRFEGYNENLAFDWVIVKVSDFEAMDTVALKKNIAAYKSAKALKARLDEKTAAYPDVDFSSVLAVYNNTSSTAEELDAAKAQIDALVLAWEAGQATPDNPRILDVIKNATFDTVGNFDGWKGTAFGAGGTSSTCAEHYNHVFNTYQDIESELPVGIYKVGVKGFHRAGGTDNDWNTKDDPSARTAKLYAVSGTDSLYTGINALADAASPTPVEGAGQEVTYAGMYLPNSMADFTVYKEAGLIKEVSVLIAVNNSKLRIGVVKESNIANDWTIVDDFTLEYYGSTLAAYELYKTQILEQTPAIEDVVTEEDTYAGSYLNAFTSAVAALEAATTAEGIAAASVAINPALDALNANIKAYNEYVNVVKTAEEYLADKGEGLDQEADTVIYLSEYLMGEYAPGEDYPFPNGSSLYILGEEPGAATLTTEQVYEEIAYLNSLVTGAAKYTKEGGDVTNLLVNPGFDTNGNGWKLGAGCSPVFSWGVAEVFGSNHGHVDISQTLTNVKPGIYSISVQAFERPAANGSYDGTEDSKVFLYMGDLETPVQNITKDALAAELAIDRENCLLSNDYLWTSADGTVSGYVPNGMEGASIAFAAGRYYQECYGLVGEDGIMKVGLTSHGVVPHWVLFDDFKLKFWGKSADAMYEVVESNWASATEYYDNYGSEMTNPAGNALNDAIAAAEASLDSEDYDTMHAALTGLTAALAAARENAAALTAWYEAYDALDVAYTAFESTASENAKLEYLAIMEAIENDAVLDFTTAELKEITTKALVVADLLPYNESYLADLERVPELPADDAAYPFDMAGYLVNGDFTDAKNGWDEVFGGGNSGALGTAYEYWNGSASALKFDLSQTFYALPAGQYSLEAEFANCWNGQSDPGNGGRAHLYADVIVLGGDTVTTSTPIEVRDKDCNQGLDPYAITFSVPEHVEGMKVVVGVRTVGVMDARWFAYDNFVLKLLANPATAIEGVENKVEAATPVAVYNISGARINNISKGINIIKMSDGSVKKVLVK